MIQLVIGGSASGKSEYAEKQAQKLAEAEKRPLIYIATMMPYGVEAAARIERHHKLRAGKGFETVECYHDLANLCGLSELKPGEAEVSDDSTIFDRCVEPPIILLECMSTLVANELFEMGKSDKEAEEAVLAGVQALASSAAHLIIVTIDIFCASQQYDVSTERYKACLGRVNRRLAEVADVCTEVVYGIGIGLKKST